MRPCAELIHTVPVSSRAATSAALVYIRAPDRTAQPEFRGIGPRDNLVEVAVLQDRQHWPEGLFLHHARAFGRVADQSDGDEIALFRVRLAANEEFMALLARVPDDGL